MPQTTRRTFTREALGSILTFSLLETLGRHDLFAGEVKPITTRWLAEVNQLGLDLKDQKLEQTQWQAKVEELYAQVDLDELLKLIDFNRLAGGAKLIDNGALSLRFKFPEVEGVPRSLSFGKQIFALKKGRSVVPHGHNNMATAFLILKGELHGRHYDRIKDEEEHFLIKPTIDRKFGPGECSTISDYKDNIHWFQAITEPSFIFNIHVNEVNRDNREPTGRLYLDPKGEQLAGGLIRAPKLGYEEAHRRYG
ncbi:MAG: hypothetical protein WD847_15110 [Pirellulales bacterium]